MTDDATPGAVPHVSPAPQEQPVSPVRREDPVELVDEPNPTSRGWAPPKSGWRGTLLFAGLIVAGALLALYAWGLPPFRTVTQTTDNAYVRGQTTTISPQVSGYVTKVLVVDFMDVPAGAPLVQIDDRIYGQRLEQAEANVQAAQANLANAQQSQRSGEAGVVGQAAAVASAQANLVRAETDMRRISELAAERSVSLRERDQAVAALRQARAAVQQAQAQRAIAQEQVRTVTVGRGALQAAVESAKAARTLAQIDLANTTIRAPQPGQVSEVGVRLGQYVTAGTQLLFLVPHTVWVVANFKEAQTAKIFPGQSAIVRVDALGGAALKGHVQQISPAAGSEFSVIRPDNATGNFVKVPQRIAVRIAIDPNQRLAQRLRPGMSVEASVDTSGR